MVLEWYGGKICFSGEFTLKMGDCVLKICDEVRDLDIIMDCDISFSSHVLPKMLRLFERYF